VSQFAEDLVFRGLKATGDGLEWTGDQGDFVLDEIEKAVLEVGQGVHQQKYSSLSHAARWSGYAGGA
jgi:hypothetical protein